MEFLTPHQFVRLAILSLCLTGGMQATPLFKPASVYSSGGLTAGSVAVGDLNRDGKPDLVVSDQGGQVGLLLGNGDGTFQTVKIIASGLVFPWSVIVADLNGDGKLDVVVADGGSCPPQGCINHVHVLLGRGDGTFMTPHVYPTGYQTHQVVAADVNGDGKLDLLVANQCLEPTCSSHGDLGVLLGNGDGTFAGVQTFDSGGSITVALAVSDLNHDGALDVALVHELGGVGVLLGNGNGTFQDAVIFNSGNVLSDSIAVADMNGDGTPDLITTISCVSTSNCNVGGVGVLLGNGNGTFQPAAFYTTNAAGPSSVAVADVNGDGKPDVMVAHVCRAFCDTSPVVLLAGNGDGTLRKPMRFYSGGRNADAIVMADVNGDAKPDAIVANKCISYADCTSGTVGVLLGTSGVETTTSISLSLNPSVYGQNVTLTATVVSTGPSAPTGTVKFQNGSTALGSATISGGTAVLVKTNLPAGSLPITAAYNGDSESARSISAAFIQVVKPASTVTTIASSPNPSSVGHSVTFTARVSSPTVRVTGTVVFTMGATTLGTVPVTAGKAIFITTALPNGKHQITANYEGTTNIKGSTASLTQTVN